MKELKSPIMKKYLQRAIRKAKRVGPPSEGMLFHLFQVTASNGWVYQAEYISDERMRPALYVTVWAFKPPKRFNARLATHFLTQELKGKK